MLLAQRIQFNYVATTVKTLLMSLFMVGLVLVSGPETAEAAVPLVINYQGKISLVSNGTNVVNGSYSFQFKLYTASTGGTAIWTETFDQPSGSCAKLVVTSGVFTAPLGSCSSLAAVDFSTNDLYLTINFAPTGTSYDGEMTPRKQLLSNPFAIQANNTNNLLGTGRIALNYQPADALNPAAQINYTPSVASSQNALNLSAGANVSGIALNVSGAGTGSLAQFDTTNASANGILIDTQSSSASQYALRVTSGNGTIVGLNVRADGNVGIGTTSPTAKLQITGGGILLDAGQGVTSSGGLVLSGSSRSITIGDSGVYSPSAVSITAGNASGIMFPSLTTFSNTTIVSGGNSLQISDVNGVVGLSLSSGISSGFISNALNRPLEISLGSGDLLLSGTGRLGVGTTSPGYKLDVSGGTGIVGQFSGRVIGGDAVNNNEFTTRSQVISLIGGGGSPTAFLQDGNSFGALTTLGTNDNFSLAFETNNVERVRIDTNGNVGIGTTVATEKLTINGNMLIGPQPNQDSGTTFTAMHATAGTWGSLSTIDGVNSSVIFNNKTYISTKENDQSQIFRHDGGTTWTLVSDSTPGKIIATDTATIDSSVLTVFNGKLYAGSQNGASSGVGGLYIYDGSSWSLVNATRGTFGSDAAMDGVGDITITNNRMHLVTQKLNASGLYRYEGGSTFTRLNATLGKGLAETTADIDSGVLITYGSTVWWGTITNSTTARLYIYTGSTFVLMNTTPGTLATGTASVPDITALAVHAGSLYIGTGNYAGGGLVAGIYQLKAGILPGNGGANHFIRLNGTLGRLPSSGAANAAYISSMRSYNGTLYVGTGSATGGSSAGLYEFNELNDFTLINSVAGTYGSNTGLEVVSSLIDKDGELYVGTLKNSSSLGGFYSWKKNNEMSYQLIFEGANGNKGKISFKSNLQAQDSRNQTGTFMFSNSISSTTGAFDIAEEYPTLDVTLKAGEVVQTDDIGNAYVKRNSGNKNIVGIISERAGFTLSSTEEDKNKAHYVPVALAGRVPVITLLREAESIKHGESLTAGALAGMAMKQSQSGVSVGKALQAYTPNYAQCTTASTVREINWPSTDVNNGEVPCYRVPLSSFTADEQSSLQASGFVSQDSVLVGKIMVMVGVQLVDIDATLSQFNTLQNAPGITWEMQANSQTAQAYLKKLAEQGGLTVAATQADTTGVRVGRLVADIEVVTPKLSTMGLVVDYIDSAENLLHFRSDIEFIGKPYVSSDTAGFAKILAGSDSVTITFVQAYLYTPSIVASISMNQHSATELLPSLDEQKNAAQRILQQQNGYAIINVTTQGFTLVLAKPTLADIEFSWIALAAKEARVFTSINTAAASTTPPQNESTVTSEPSVPSETNTQNPTQSATTPEPASPLADVQSEPVSNLTPADTANTENAIPLNPN